MVSQYFWPENFRVNDLCTELLKLGHEVTVLTGIPNYPEGVVYPEFIKNRTGFSEFQGARVVRVPMVSRGKNNKLKLLLNYSSYFISASTIGLFKLRGEKFDFIFVFGVSPVSVAIPAIFKKWIDKSYVAFWVLDLWPDTLIDLGVLKRNSLLEKVVSKFVKFIYNQVDVVLGQSPSFVKKINARLTNGKQSSLMYNWAEDIFSKNSMPNSLLEKNDSSLKILFAGNIGESQDFPSVIKAMTLLKDTPAHWFILGGGRELDSVKDAVMVNALMSNVTFIDAVPLEHVPSFYKAADVLFVSLKSGGAFSNTIPGKIQSYMAAGKPILGMLDGDGNELIKESGSGLSCKSGDYEALALLVRNLLQMSSADLNKLGQNGKQYYSRCFRRDVIVNQLLDNYIKDTKSHAGEDIES